MGTCQLPSPNFRVLGFSRKLKYTKFIFDWNYLTPLIGREGNWKYAKERGKKVKGKKKGEEKIE